LLFPDLVRRFVADGAGVLLAVTNDAWYGRTGAPHQFLAMTAMRSAETGRFTSGSEHGDLGDHRRSGSRAGAECAVEKPW
jgi:hypothetical protein